MFLLHNKLTTQGEKHETSTQNLQWNNIARQVEGFCISYFAAFRYMYMHLLSKYNTWRKNRRNVRVTSQNPTLFMTKIYDFPYPGYDLIKRFDTLFKTWSLNQYPVSDWSTL